MFPDGFHLQIARDGCRLLLAGRVIATVTDLERGGCRICQHPSLARHMGFEFSRSRAGAVRYLERWASKWEAELRELYGRRASGYFSGEGDRAPPMARNPR